MNKEKGFLLTITTLYYVAIFIIFLSLIVFMSIRTTGLSAEKTQNQRNNNLFIQGNASVPQSTTYYWCSYHVGNYDANTTLGTQSSINYKRYCEGYDGKRII